MRRSLLILFICAFAMGCNSDPRYRRETALLRAEILDLEDKYYLLKSKHEQVLSQLGGNAADYYVDGSVIDETIVGQERIVDGEIFDYEQNDLDVVDDLVPGEVILDEAYGSSVIVDGAAYRPGTQRSSDLGVPGLTMNPPQRLATGAQANANQITEVAIHPDVSGGRDVDGKPGHEGLDLLIQTKTADGRNVLQSGILKITVVDPQQPADLQRIGSWEFLEDELPLFFANDEIGSDGILLHLPWDESTPVHSRLIINVAFRTQDGRRLSSSSQVRIAPPRSDYSPLDPVVTGWTRRDARWLTGGGNPAASRRTIPATPAKARINKPKWRPVR